MCPKRVSVLILTSNLKEEAEVMKQAARCMRWGSSAPMPAPVPPAPAQQAGYTLRIYGPIPVVFANTSVTPGIAGLYPVGIHQSGNRRQRIDERRWQHHRSRRHIGSQRIAGQRALRVPGQALGYEDFIEMDFVEYNIENIQANDYVYSGSMIDWNGVFGQTCSNSYCAIENSYTSKIRQLPETVDFSVYHSYGALWVPATADTDGYLQWYFDGAPVGQQVSWPELTDSSVVPPPPFGIADQQHLVVILGTGTQYPMTISSVSVWQKSRADNLIR